MDCKWTEPSGKPDSTRVSQLHRTRRALSTGTQRKSALLPDICVPRFSGDITDLAGLTNSSIWRFGKLFLPIFASPVTLDNFGVIEADQARSPLSRRCRGLGMRLPPPSYCTAAPCWPMWLANVTASANANPTDHYQPESDSGSGELHRPDRVLFNQRRDEKSFRECLPITTRDVCAEAGSPRPTVSRGPNAPSYVTSTDTIERLCRYCACKPGDLFALVEEQPDGH